MAHETKTCDECGRRRSVVTRDCSVILEPEALLLAHKLHLPTQIEYLA